MKEPDEIEPAPVDDVADETENTVDPAVREAAESLPAYRDYIRELNSERLTLGDF